MANKLYDEVDVQAVARAIRERNGSDSLYKLSEMPDVIRGIGKLLSNTEIPDYVKKEAMDVAKKVESLKSENSVIFLSMSDFHHVNDESVSEQVNINNGNLHACMGAKILSYVLDLDFSCMLGDIVWGSSATTEDLLKKQHEDISKYLLEGWGDIAQFRTCGNHDGGAYAGMNVGREYLFSHIGEYNDGAKYGSITEGYCYRDFASKKLRVICLNTAEGGVKEAISVPQLLWFASVLKNTPNNYGIIILSHHPLDWGAVCQASNVLYQYVNKGSVTYNGITTSFADTEAKVLCTIHGHTHCFKTAKLNYISNSQGVEYDVYRIATPNACFSRNNEYGSNGTTEYYGIEFGEETSYPKTADSATDTAFVVNVLNLDEMVLHSVCYGAGYDRVISLGNSLVIVTQPLNIEVSEGTSVTWSVTASGDELTYLWQYSSNNGTDWDELSTIGITGTSSITIPSSKVTTSMNGWKIRCKVSDKYGNNITSSIATLTVNSKFKGTNLVPTLLSLDTANQTTPTGIFKDVGYLDGAYLSTASPYYNASDAARVTTGLLPYTKDTQKPIYIKGATWGTASHDRIGYRTKNHVSSGIYSTLTLGSANFLKLFTYENLGTNYFKLTPKSAESWENLCSGITHIAFSFVGKGEDLIITIDEPIEY